MTYQRCYNRSHAHRIDLRDPQSDYNQKQNDQPDGLQNWKQDFLGRRENQWLCDIPDEFIQDKFNIYGLQDEIKDISICCEIIQGKLNTSALPKSCEREITKNLPIVYGLIHARYILSPDGLEDVKEKFLKSEYGFCPRLNCNNTPLLPIGLSSKLNVSPVKAFCYCCREIYEPKPANKLDGAFFGPNMAHVFIDEMKKNDKLKPIMFVPFHHTAFGFRTRNSSFQVENDS